MTQHVAGKTPASSTVRTASPLRAPTPHISAAPGLSLQRACACGELPGSGGKCSACDDKDKNRRPLQRASAGAEAPTTLPASVDSVLSSPGRPLDGGARSFMESRFGRDFGQVRVHDDAAAARSARDVNAHAYTVGNDIAFAPGKYDPQSHTGRHLLAHELAHTVQQQGLQRKGDELGLDRGGEYQRLEQEAELAASSVMEGGRVSFAQPATQPLLARAGDGTAAPAKKKAKDVHVTSDLGSHKVTPTEVFTAGGADLEEFTVDVFYLPATKGPDALKAYQAMASTDGKENSLESTLSISGNKTKTALWQKRESTGDLRDLWLQKMGWSAASADDLWKRAGGDKEFPLVDKKTCQMDHIVELQVGGNNSPENIQPLDGAPNRESGGEIRRELESLTTKIANTSSLSSGSANQIKLRFESVKQAGAPKPLPKSCPPQPRSCLAVEECGKKLKVAKAADGSVGIARVDYPLSAGGRATVAHVADTFAKAQNEVVPLRDDPLNEGPSTLIPGLLLTELRHHKQKKKPDVVAARIDERAETRLPISLPRDSAPLLLSADANGVLKLDPASKKGGVAFTYKYLSPGRITELNVDPAGNAAWKGVITPSVPFLGDLGVEYSGGELSVVKGLDEAELKKKSVLGLRVTKAEVKLKLAPDFKPSGVVELQAGPANDPLATARLELSADDIGLVAKGSLKVNVPKMKAAESEITYKGGGGRNEWHADIHIASQDIQLGSSISVSGGFDAKIDAKGIDFVGKIDATFPGNNHAQLGLKKEADDWLLFGTGKFHFPKLDETTVSVAYHLGRDRLVARGKTGFELAALNLQGHLDEVIFVIEKGHSPRVSGKGGLDFKRGKAAGHVEVVLHESGNFSGKGSLTYQLKDNLIVTGTVILNEEQKLRVEGELLVTRYELFKKHEDERELFSTNLSVGVPGLSIGTSGLVFKIGGGVTFAYSFGPGVIEPLKLSAGFDPLEADPNLELAVSGSIKVPASATLSANITGSLGVQVDVLVGSAGAEAGLKLKGDLTLSAGAFANFDAQYKQKHLTAKVTAGIDTKLLLGLTLSAFAHAWAGGFGVYGHLRKDWTLAHKTVDTQLGFFVSAPFEYSDDKGVKLPEVKDLTVKTPELTTENMSRILKEIFSSAPEKQTES